MLARDLVSRLRLRHSIYWYISSNPRVSTPAKRDNVVQPSLINIPFSRNRKFIGREQLLTRLSYYLQVFLPLQTPQGRIGLWAMGGGG